MGDFVPVILSLGAGLLFALGTHFLSLGLRYTDAQTGALIEIGTAAAFYWILMPLFVEWSYWLTGAALIFAILGLFRPAVSSNLATRGVHYLGPTLTSAFSSTTPIFAACFGVFLLGEHLTPPIAAGTVAIIAALVVLSYRGNIKTTWPLWALVLPIGAALIRSGAHAGTKFGLEILPSPFFAGLVTYSVSLVVALAAQRVRRVPMPRMFAERGLLWFVGAGLMHALAVLMMNTAFKTGQVIVVVPIVSTYPFFTLGLSYLVFRRETLTRRTILATVLVVAGVVFVALSR